MRLERSCSSIKWVGPSGARTKLHCDRPLRHAGNHYDSNADVAWVDETPGIAATEKGDVAAAAGPSVVEEQLPSAQQNGAPSTSSE